VRCGLCESGTYCSIHDEPREYEPPAHDVPSFFYFNNASLGTSRVYHVRNCNGKLSEKTKVEATESNANLLRTLGYTVCKTCRLRYEKDEKAREHADLIETYRIAGLVLPPEFELRVYWHRGRGNPVEIWSSKH
jgi:hypothetical protein